MKRLMVSLDLFFTFKCDLNVKTEVTFIFKHILWFVTTITH